MHYGIKGMRWGVRRASKKLKSASTDEERSKAVATLQSHKDRASKKLSKLSKQREKMQGQYEKSVWKDDVKAAKLSQKAAKQRRKAQGIFVSSNKAAKRLAKAEVLQMKADKLKTRSDVVKAKVERNESMQAAFKKGIETIDAALVANGKKYMRK